MNAIEALTLFLFDHRYLHLDSETADSRYQIITRIIQRRIFITVQSLVFTVRVMCLREIDAHTANVYLLLQITYTFAVPRLQYHLNDLASSAGNV